MGGLGSQALDVGSGSGFLSAVMALLVEPGGRVTGVEQVPALAERSLQSIQVRDPCPLPVYRVYWYQELVQFARSNVPK